MMILHIEASSLVSLMSLFTYYLLLPSQPPQPSFTMLHLTALVMESIALRPSAVASSLTLRTVQTKLLG